MKVKTFDGKVFDVPEENLESFLSEYNDAFMPQEPERGTNIAGAIRNVAQTVPLFGTYSDEAEATLRSPYELASTIASASTGMPKSIISSLITPENQIGEYEKLRRNAEESAKGNVTNTSYGRALNIGSLMAGNAVLAGLTGGMSLLPVVSGAQGAIEGFGEGNNLNERLFNAGVQGTGSFLIPKWLNKLLPTKSVNKEIIKSYAKRPLETAKLDKKAGLTILARALASDKPIEQVIAEDVSKGYRKNLWNNLRRVFRNEDILRSKFYTSAAELERPLYGEYVEKEVRSVAPKYANKIGQNINKMKLEEKGSDIITDINIKDIAKQAVNDTMRKAPAADKKLVGDTIETAIAKKGVAKKIQDVSIASPSEFEGTGSSLIRILTNIPKNLSSWGAVRSMTKAPVGDAFRGGLDTFLEEALSEKFKTE